MSYFQDTHRAQEEDTDYGSAFRIHFTKESFLGSGSFGTCVSAIHKSTNQCVAVKVTFSTPFQQ
jgi:serine/threonine protein kinase